MMRTLHSPSISASEQGYLFLNHRLHGIDLISHYTAQSRDPITDGFLCALLAGLVQISENIDLSYAFMDSDILPFFSSTSRTVTSTISPTDTTSRGCLIYLSAI